ncbi:MAG: hypothetical protein IT450_12980 [Phycisphaerales bacterium]|nr:hypothetical protein [Phycisphaerales bacterium]
MRSISLILAAFGVGALILSGCDKPAAEKPAGGASAQPAAAIPATLFLTEAPAESKDVSDIKKTGESGQEVVVAGRIGGSEDPFVDGRAVFTLADSKMKACDEMDMADACKKPWDYCCEPRESLIANTCTIQVVGTDGRPLKATLNGAGKLAPGARIIVKGKIAQKQEQTLVINADAIFVKS